MFKNIGDLLFSGCTSLSSIDIPENVTSINYQAFEGSGISSILIPGNITNIEEYAFGKCTQLQEVTIEWETPLSIMETVFSEVDLSLCILKVPQGTLPAYQINNLTF